jgi:hypothetical protein
MIQRDYIMRITEMLAKALARILLLKEQKQYDQALDEIDLTGRELLGNDFTIIKNLSDTDLIKWMFSDGYFDSAKCISLSQLLRAEGEIFELMGKDKHSRIRYLQALNLLNESLNQDDRNRNEVNLEMMKWLMNKTVVERIK